MKPHLLAATVVFSLILLVPGGAFANQQPGDDNTDTFTGNNEFEDDHPDYSKDGNWETNETELKQAHSEITNLMITQNDTPLEQYTGPDIPLTMVYIDDDTLVVGLDTMAAYFDIPIEPGLIQEILGIDAPVEIKYVEFQPESHSSQDRIKQWQDRYKNSCMPVKAGYQKVCEIYKKTMIQLHVPIPASVTTLTSPVVTPPTQTSTSPCTDEPKSNTCYYYKLYQDRCTGGNTYKRCGTYSSIIKNAGYDLPTDSGTISVPPPKPVIVPTYELQNIKTVKSGDDITVSWDRPTDYTVRYYKMYVSIDGGYAVYKGKLSSTDTSYTISNVHEGKNYKLKIKLYYTNDRGSTSIKYFYSDVVNVPVTMPTCTGSQILQGNACVDRCPASNEEWRNGVCTVVSCPSGQIIQNNTCVDKPKPPIVTSSVNKTSIFSTDQTTGFCPIQLRESGGCIGPYVNDDKISTTYTQPVSIDNSIYGGQLLLYFPGYEGQLDNSKNPDVPSTITLPVTKNGISGFIMSAHGLIPTNVTKGFVVDNSGDLRVSIKLGPIKIAENIGPVSDSDLIGIKADSAFIPSNPNIPTTKHTILNGTDTIHVTQFGGVKDVERVNDEIFMIGAYNQAKGFIAHTNVTLQLSQTNSDYVYHEQILSVYPSYKGDSGAPVIEMLDDYNARILGIHVGKACIFKLENQTDFNTFPVFEQCIEDHGAYFKFFSTWENIVNKTGIDG